jgi:hypothetical protein
MDKKLRILAIVTIASSYVNSCCFPTRLEAIEGISIGQNHNGTTSTVQVSLIIVITGLEAIEGISIGQNHNGTTSTVQVIASNPVIAMIKFTWTVLIVPL